ncbi:hypothetical protein Tco_0488253 [Tanacetum coccineum]
MAALIKRKKQALAEKLAKERMDRPMTQAQQRTYMRQFVKNQSSALYSTGWTKAKVEGFTDAQLKEEFEKIQKALANTQVQAFSRTLKRTCTELEAPSSKQQKSTKAPIPSVPDVPQPPVVSSPKSSGTRRKSLGRNHLTKPKYILKELDLDADDKTFIKFISDEDSTKEALIIWMDQCTKHFTTLKEILHMVDRQDLLKLYGMVVKYYENHPVAGAGLMLWGDLQSISWKGCKSTSLEIDKDVCGPMTDTADQLIESSESNCSSQFLLFDTWTLVFHSPMLYLLRLEMVINSPWIMPLLGTKGLASPEQTATGVASPRVSSYTGKAYQCLTHLLAVVPKSVAGSRFPEGSSMLLTFVVQVQQGYADYKLSGSKNED